jgi:ankyrin repeat protein
MPSLASFPPEILRIISNNGSGETICNLFCCGNRALNDKLCSPSGINSFVAMNEFHVFRCFPSVIYQLQGLRVLRIGNPLTSSPILFLSASDLSNLPCGLLEITFSFANAEECWIRSTRRTNEGFWKPDANYEVFDFKTHFPKLHTLSLTSKMPQSKQNLGMLQLQVYPYAWIGVKEVLTFPSTLTSFEIASHLLDIDIASLPNGLEVMKSNCEVTRQDNRLLHLSNLSLRVLELPNVLSLPPTVFNSLPHTLIRLNLQSCQMTDKIVEFLPRGLESAILNQLSLTSQASVLSLPPTLTELAIIQWLAPNISLQDLPLTMKILKIWDVSEIEEENFGFLPRNLLSLTMSCSRKFESFKKIDQLPPNLTNLNIPMKKHKCLHQLPPNLTTLTLSRCSTIKETVLKSLPKSVTRVELDGGNTWFRVAPDASSLENNQWITPHMAAILGPWEILDSLKSRGADFLYLDPAHGSLAHAAAQAGNIDVLKYLYRKGDTFSQKKNNTESVLEAAVISGQLDIFKFLIETKLPVFQSKVNILGALVTAAQCGHLNIFQYMKTQLQFDLHLDRRGAEIVHLAARYGHLEVFKWIKEEGYNMNATDKNGWSALTHATIGGSLEILQWIKTFGLVTTFSEKDVEGFYLIHHAARHGHLHVLKWFRQIGMDMTLKSRSRETIQSIAIIMHYTAITQWIEAGMLV